MLWCFLDVPSKHALGLICARLDVVDVIVPAQVVAYCYS
jgi:hypothetical protein